MEENKDTDIDVEYKICSECGQKKELNEKNFGHHAKTKDGWANKCLQCRSQIMRKSNKERFAVVIKDKIKSMDIDSANKPIIELDFTNHIETYQDILQVAQHRLRSPKNQVMWWLINCDFEKLQTK